MLVCDWYLCFLLFRVGTILILHRGSRFKGYLLSLEVVCTLYSKGKQLFIEIY